MAGDTSMTRLLIGLGLRSFSMHPSQILAVKQQILRCDTTRLQSWAHSVLLADDPALMLGVAGIVCVAWQARGMPSEAPVSTRLTGFLCAIGALASWTAYAVSNSRWLARLDHVSSYEWNLLTGLVTGGLAVLLAVPAFMGSSAADHSAAQWGRFIGVAASMAVVASVVGNAFWNRASRLLPLTMIGQMILFETLFALLYGFLWEARWPTALEALAMVLVGASVLAGISAHQPRQPVPEHGN